MTDAAAAKDTQKADDSTQKQPEQAGTTPSQGDSTAVAGQSSGDGQTSASQEGAATAENPAASTSVTENRNDTGPASRPRAPSSDSRGTSRGLEQNRPASIPKRPDVDRISSSNQTPRSQTHTPSRNYREETRLPPRPDLLDDRRDRNADFRGGRFGSDHDYNRSFDQSAGDGRSFGRLERDYPRGPMDEPFRAHPYRDGRPPLDPDWHDRSGRLRTSDARSGPPTHPDRVDMIHEHADPGYRRGDPSRPEKDDRRLLPPARTSPQRVELPNRPERFPADDRRSLNYPPTQSRHDDLPTGPRSDRHGRAPLDGTDSREPAGPDLNHGRLRQPDAPADIPLGPRGRNAPGRGGRNAPNMSHPPPPASGHPAERQPPTGPGRQGMRGGPDPNTGGASSPAAEKLEATGMHPDRLKAFQQQPQDGGAHSGPPRAGPHQSQPSVVPPSGPRSALGPPSGPSSLPRGPAPGPGFSGERGRGDKRFAGINNMLQQSGGPPERGGSGPPIRGRGANRQANANSPQASRQLTPVGASDDGGRSGSFQNKPDLLANRPSATHADDDSSHRSRRGEPTEEGPESRRSARYSSGAGGHSHDRGDRDNRDRERERDRRGGDEEGTRGSSRREEYRDRNRDYERERSRRGDAAGAGGSRDERYESREVARRGAGSREDNRRRRDRDDGAVDQGSQEHEGRLRPPSFGGQTAPASSGGNPEEDRRWGGRDRSSRDRPRDRDYHREGGTGGGPHRKRGRPGGDEGNHGDGGGRGGMRMGGENKRPRRGA